MTWPLELSEKRRTLLITTPPFTMTGNCLERVLGQPFRCASDHMHCSLPPQVIVSNFCNLLQQTVILYRRRAMVTHRDRPQHLCSC